MLGSVLGSPTHCPPPILSYGCPGWLYREQTAIHIIFDVDMALRAVLLAIPVSALQNKTQKSNLGSGILCDL